MPRFISQRVTLMLSSRVMGLAFLENNLLSHYLGRQKPGVGYGPETAPAEWSR